MKFVLCMIFLCFNMSKDVLLSELSLCQQPENLEQIYRNTIPTYQNVSHHPSLLRSFSRFCPNSQSNVRVGLTTPLSERSTCPYYHVTTHDSSRFPTFLTEARCKCDKCLDYYGISPRNVCERVYQDIKVLVRSENNTWVYGTYRCQVGCTCAMPREVVQSVNENRNGPIPM